MEAGDGGEEKKELGREEKGVNCLVFTFIYYDLSSSKVLIFAQIVSNYEW